MQNVSTVEFRRDGAFMKKIHLLLSVTELIQSTFTEHRQWPLFIFILYLSFSFSPISNQLVKISFSLSSLLLPILVCIIFCLTTATVSQLMPVPFTLLLVTEHTHESKFNGIQFLSNFPSKTRENLLFLKHTQKFFILPYIHTQPLWLLPTFAPFL